MNKGNKKPAKPYA